MFIEDVPEGCSDFRYYTKLFDYGDLDSAEVRIRFYVDAVAWTKIEKSPIWKEISDFISEREVYVRNLYYRVQYLGCDNQTPFENQVQFFLHYPCWLEVEKSQIWHQLAEQVRGHQRVYIHQEIPSLVELSEPRANISLPILEDSQKKACTSLFQSILEGVRTLFHRQRRE